MIIDFLWILAAIASTFFFAAIAEVNRIFQVEGFKLTFLKASFAFLFTLPFFPLFFWPEENRFYSIILTHGLMSVYAMSVFFDLSARYKTRISSIYLAISALSTFAFWYVLKPDQFTAIMENPITGVGAIIAFVGILIVAQFIRKSDFNINVLFTLLPLGVLFGVVNAFIRLFLENDYPILEAGLTFVSLSFLITAIASCVYLFTIKTKISFDRSSLKQGAILGGLYLGAFLSSIIAIVHAPNPAYPGAIVMSVPVVIFAYHKVCKTKEDANITMVALMVLLTAALIYLVA